MALYCGYCRKYYNPADPTKIIGCDCHGAKESRRATLDRQIREASERNNAPERVQPQYQPAAWDIPDTVREQIRADVINSPETADFMAGVPLEAAHQRERWSADHDAGKSPFDWFWLIGYLAQKAAASAVAGDLDKAMHHTISTAAALANWHAALAGIDTAMRPGIDPATHQGAGAP